MLSTYSHERYDTKLVQEPDKIECFSTYQHNQLVSTPDWSDHEVTNYPIDRVKNRTVRSNSNYFTKLILPQNDQLKIACTWNFNLEDWILETTPNLNLPYIAAAQAQKHVTHNEAIQSLDALVQLSVIDRDLSAPPVSNTEGDRYIVASTASGSWLGKEGYIAVWQSGAWAFHQPQIGWICWISDENSALGWDGLTWNAIATIANPTALVGVNATADLANRLSVSSSASLFSHAGTDHRVKVNKNTTADVASFIFQDAFSGRAEIGLIADNDFQFKVSPDGIAWKNAMQIDQNTGEVSFPFTSFGGGNAGNMLINGHMVINQRGFAGGALTAGAYGFDRWKADSGGCNLSVSGDTITLTSGTILQIIEAPLLAGEQVVLSVEELTSGDLDIDIEGITGTITAGAGRKGVVITVPLGSTGNITVKLTPATGAITFNRIKLETGTAASAWVQPNAGLELILCQRYALALASSGTKATGFGYPTTSTSIIVVVPTPVEMRNMPSVTVTPGNTRIYHNGVVKAPTGVGVVSLTPIGVTLSLVGTGFSIYQAAVFSVLNGQTLILDAEL